jgi:hypothetical protein
MRFTEDVRSGRITPAVEALARMWSEDVDVDYFLSVSFDERAHMRYRLDDPQRTIAFGRRVLESVGYRGPFVMVAHDNADTRYFHLHMLVQGGPAIDQARIIFKTHGDVDTAENGPVRGLGAFLYCAGRAVHDGMPNGDYWDMETRWRRRPRPRGRGGSGRRPEGATPPRTDGGPSDLRNGIRR